MKLFVFTILIFLSSLSANGQSGIRINGETQVVCEGQVQLVVSGDFVNNGTFTPSNGTIYLKGSSKQNIGGSGNNTFYGIELDNAAGADLSSDIAVTNELNLNSGLLDLVNSFLSFLYFFNMFAVFSSTELICRTITRPFQCHRMKLDIGGFTLYTIVSPTPIGFILTTKYTHCV